MTRILQATVFTLLTLVSALDGFTVAKAGTITVFQRESKAENVLFAGSGGAVDQRDENDLLGSLTGPFSFSDLGSVAVFESQPFSTGTADATGAISVTDNVVQSSSSSLLLTATRTASAVTNSISGPSNATSTQGQTFRVRFTIDNDPVRYSLTGSFDPGATTGTIGETGRVSLRRPFTTLTPISITTATAAINETGILMPGNTFEFLVRMTDKTSANSGSPFGSDASNLNIVFTLQPIPEPSTALLLLVGMAPFARRRLRSRC